MSENLLHTLYFGQKSRSQNVGLLKLLFFVKKCMNLSDFHFLIPIQKNIFVFTILWLQFHMLEWFFPDNLIFLISIWTFISLLYSDFDFLFLWIFILSFTMLFPFQDKMHGSTKLHHKITIYQLLKIDTIRSKSAK